MVTADLHLMGIAVPLLYQHAFMTCTQGSVTFKFYPPLIVTGVLCVLMYNFIAEWVVPVGDRPRIPAWTPCSVGNIIEHRGRRHVRGQPFCYSSAQGSWVVWGCWPGCVWGPADQSWVSLYKYHTHLWNTACIRRSSSAMWCHVAGWIVPNVQENCSHWVTDAWHFETTGLFWNVRYHILEE